jgi:hypothetical protein
MAIVSLTARADFKKGDTGYATGDSVGHARSGFVPEGSLVRALEDVRSGEKGKFEEVKESKSPTTSA